MAQPRYACRACGTWKCTACGWKRPGASTRYPDQMCGKCGGTQGTITPTMHTGVQWLHHNEASAGRPPAGVRPAPEPRVADTPPELYRGVLVPKQGPYQRLDLVSWKRGVDDCLKRFPRREKEQ